MEKSDKKWPGALPLRWWLGGLGIYRAVLLVFIFSLMPGVMAGEAEDYQLIQSQVADEVATRDSPDKAIVYVLLCPDHRVYVFRSFYSHQMEEILKCFPKESVLLYQGPGPGGLLPSQAQLAALEAFCKSKGIVLKMAPIN